MTSCSMDPARQLSAEPSLVQRRVRSSLFERLRGLRGASIEVIEGSTRTRLGAERSDANVALEVHDPRFYSDLLVEGSLGAARSWIDGRWSSPDLTALLRVVIREPSLFGGLDGRFAEFMSLLRRARAVVDRNSRSGSRRNIAAHYDIGNDLFERMLDPSMTYSSGVFPTPGASLEDAQFEKYDRICRRLGLSKEHRLLEIGTGWGGFALHAARGYGADVTTTTISREQHALARERFARDEAGERIDLRFEDYRDLTGRFDRLVSIEMIEAVGERYYDGYFRACSERLAADGAMSIQAIVIGDQNYEAATRHVDFIKKYVFPGGCIPSISRISDSVARNTDLRIHHLEDITPHYAETLRRWRSNFAAAERELRAAGYDDGFIRMWNYYLSYCEAGFDERHTACVQIDFVKPQWRPAA